MKASIRKDMKATLASLPAEEIVIRSRMACEHVSGSAEFRSAGAIMGYMPIPGEVDCLPLALSAWQAGKTFLVPRVSWDQRRMLAVRIDSLDDDLHEARYGIREPVRGEPWPIEDIDLIIVPALAYDRSGNRLGRGGGFYDRFLADPHFGAITCGLAFAEQVMPELPSERHDRPVDMLATDTELLRFR
jgi:5-formyltetrahydrofolate cyclo-ligase